MADETQHKPAGTREGAPPVRGGEIVPRPEQQIIPNPAIETGIFTTVTLIDGLRFRYPVPSFLRDTFFSAREYVDTDAVQVDTYRGGRSLAPRQPP
jgi:hypothetical protein